MTTFIETLERLSEKSLVCVGLDTDYSKIPEGLRSEKFPLFEFNRAIVDATHDLVCCYKPNAAFYSGAKAEAELEMTIEYIHNYKVPVILDSKRGDIGNTAELYAREAFDRYRADAVTVNPFMGSDSLEPFLKRSDRGIIILCRTSNAGGAELQNLRIEGKPLYAIIAEMARDKWNRNKNVLLVVGATSPEELGHIRSVVGDMTLLIPGVGAQGGDVETTVKAGKNSRGAGMIINSSRGIIYASSGLDFAEAARRETEKLRQAINSFR